jgi:hypothetical protein
MHKSAQFGPGGTHACSTFKLAPSIGALTFDVTSKATYGLRKDLLKGGLYVSTLQLCSEQDHKKRFVHH